MSTVTSLVTSTRTELITSIAMDDGKVNALSVRMLGELNRALDQAEADGTAVLLTGRAGVFSAGFDLKVFKEGGEGLIEMLDAGAATAERLLAFPAPVVIACSGHAIAMGVFVVLSGDVRIGIDGGPFRMSINEVAIGMTLPRFATEMCRQRLTPAAFNRATLTAESFDPSQAMAAGLLDTLAAAGDLLSAAQDKAAELAQLPRRNYVATKRRVRGATLAALSAAKQADMADWRARGTL